MKTLCVLTAGKGSRLSGYSKLVNKALLPINKKAAISHIIDNFPKDTKLVIAIGHLGDQVKDFLTISYPKRKIIFVKIKNYAGKKSGPGKSLLACKKFLKKDFYFASCDTIWTKKIKNKEIHNWMGVSKKLFYNPREYCNLLSNNKKIINIKDKTYASKKYKHFIGLAYIKDHDLFWSGFELAKKNVGEYQVIDGFRNLIKFSNIKEKKLEWYDIGNYKNYHFTLNKFEKFNFRKTSEFIYINKNNIIKFINSNSKIKKLINRTKQIKLFPPITRSKKQFIQYKYVKGEILYKLVNRKNFSKLLNYLNKNLWCDLKKIGIKAICKKFYHKKTLDRINLYFHKYNLKKDNIKNINKIDVPPIDELLTKVPWNEIYDGIASKIHGDLHFDNIIFDKKKFTLIDWREDFGGSVKYGDLYYDFSKLYGGIEMNYDIIKKGKFSYKEKIKKISYHFQSRKKLMNKIKTQYEKFLTLNNFSLKKVKIIKCLIHLNMSPLHEYPFDKLLFSHSKLELFKVLKEYEYISK
jgi:choline kinase